MTLSDTPLLFKLTENLTLTELRVQVPQIDGAKKFCVHWHSSAGPSPAPLIRVRNAVQLEASKRSRLAKGQVRARAGAPGFFRALRRCQARVPARRGDCATSTRGSSGRGCNGSCHCQWAWKSRCAGDGVNLNPGCPGLMMNGGLRSGERHGRPGGPRLA